MTQQYPLPLPHREAMGADDFLIASGNREAIAWIDKWPDWPAHCLAIYGPAGAGKTHLAHVWQTKSGGRFTAADSLGADHGAFAQGNVIVDDAEAIGGDPAKERGLLHLYNMLREAKGFLFLTGRHAPAQWRINLPDLRSRLAAAPAVALAPPDDELLSALLVKQFGDRQLNVGIEVIDFILPRITREPGVVRDLVNRIDRASLAEGRKITIALAKRVLEKAG